MPLEPKDITEERLMALCRATDRCVTVLAYILDKALPLDDALPHRMHVERDEMRKELHRASNDLQRYFLGD